MLEVLQDFPSASPPLEWLLQTVPRLRPRLFSISSATAAHPAQAHVTAAIVDWVTPFKRRRQVPAAVHMILTAWVACVDLPPCALCLLTCQTGSISSATAYSNSNCTQP